MYCILKMCCIISVLFSAKYHLCLNFIFLCWNNTFLINHALKLKYQPICLKVNVDCYRCSRNYTLHEPKWLFFFGPHFSWGAIESIRSGTSHKVQISLRCILFIVNIFYMMNIHCSIRNNYGVSGMIFVVWLAVHQWVDVIASKVCRIAENMFRKCVLHWNYVFCKARWHIMGNILSWVSRTCMTSLATKSCELFDSLQ